MDPGNQASQAGHQDAGWDGEYQAPGEIGQNMTFDIVDAWCIY